MLAGELSVGTGKLDLRVGRSAEGGLGNEEGVAFRSEVAWAVGADAGCEVERRKEVFGVTGVLA